ncbi:hypothetical protein Pan216_23840 [Planctomycetes bacterium Pan216]|uniref:Caspase domain protein n=1 Tax=Kolteria novifilia TaxID=2527975 RepID=A0A518B3F4_9BACT|nr:hypothetical protein Pan216_23840 [Planctomycetes bacterium Pan216]
MSTPGSESERRSWRKSSGRNGPKETPATDDQNRDDSSKTPSAKRFRGGSTTVINRGKHTPAWLRVFLPSVALFVVVGTLGALLFWLAPAQWVKPLLVAWSVTDYQSSLIPTNDFGLEDVKTIQRSDLFTTGDRGLSQNTANMQTLADFRTFFEESLQRVENDTVVVYLSTHGISGPSGAYLLTSEASPTTQAGRYPLRTLLESMATCPAKNKMLVLDATKVDTDLDIGLLGNDFVDWLKHDLAEIEEKAKASPELVGNLCVCCSSGEGERAWSSYSLGHSIFGLTMAYCLQGGPEANLPDDQGERDQVLTANEILEFANGRVTAWAAKYRKADQQPFATLIGDDFALVSVNESITATSLLEEPAEEPEEVKEEPPHAPGEEKTSTKSAKESPPEDEAPKKKEPPPPTKQEILEALLAAWQRSTEIGQTHAVLVEPLLWATLQNRLLRAEELFRAGQADDAYAMLQGPIAETERALLESGDESPDLWSLAFHDADDRASPLAAPSKAAQAVLEDPSEKRLATIAESGLVETDLLRFMARVFRNHEGTAWTDTDLANFALETQSLAASSSKLSDPLLLTMARKELAEADSEFREGLVALMLARLDDSQDHFRQAREAYQTSKSKLSDLEEEYAIAFRIAGSIPYIIRWLADDPADRESKAADLMRLAEYLDRLRRFGADPSTMQLRLLAKASQDLLSQAENYAENAREWRQYDAALRLPFLDPQLRRSLLSRVLEESAESPITLSPSRYGTPDLRAAANPFPLDGYLELTDDNERLVQAFQQLSPSAPSRLTRQSMVDDPSTRGLRAQAGQRLATFLGRVRSRPSEMTEPGNLWQRLTRSYLLAPFRVQGKRSASGNDTSFDQLLTEGQSDYLRWQIERLQANDRSLPFPVYSTTIRHLTERTRDLDPSFRASRSWPLFSLESSRQLVLPEQGTASLPFAIKANQSLGANGATLTFDWLQGRENLKVGMEGRTSATGQMIVPMPALKAGDLFTSNLTIERTSPSDNTQPIPLYASVRLENGRREWFQLALQPPAKVVKPAQILASWDDRTGRDDRIELYPNQQIPLKLGIRKNVDRPMSLRLEIGSQGRSPAVLPIEAKEGKSERLPVPAPEKWNAMLGGSEFQLKLYEGETLLDQADVRVNVIVPSEFLGALVRYNPDRRELSVLAQTSAASDAKGEIPLKLEIPTIDVKQGTLATVIAEGERSAQLGALLPPEADDRDLVIALSVSGVPRALRFRVGADRPQGQPFREISLGVASPTPGAKYLQSADLKSIPITLQADGPDIEPLRVFVGLDRNANDRLEDSERGNGGDYPAGRDVGLELVANPDEPGFLLRSRVTDLILPLRATGLRGRQVILANLLSGNQSLSKAIEVYFLTSAPQINIVRPLSGTTLRQGSDLPVTVQTEDPGDAGAVDEMHFGFDLNRNGNLDADEEVQPLGNEDGRPVTFGADGRVSVRLGVDHLIPGSALLIVQGESLVADPKSEGGVKSLKSNVVRRALVIRPRPEMKADAKDKAAKKAPPKNGDIKGKVMVGPTGKKGATVTIEGVGSTKTGFGGAFEFRDVPPGNYAVKASSPLRQGKAEVRVESDKTSEVTVNMTLK